MIKRRSRWIGEADRLKRLQKKGTAVDDEPEYQTCGTQQCVDTYDDVNNCGSCGNVVSSIIHLRVNSLSLSVSHSLPSCLDFYEFP